MTKIVIIAVLGFTAAVCHAQDPNLADAQAALEAAWNHLQASPYTYGGHRDKALGHIRKALEEVRRAEVEPPAGGKEERKREKRALKLEHKEEKREQQLEHKEQQREEELEERNH